MYKPEDFVENMRKLAGNMMNQNPIVLLQSKMIEIKLKVEAFPEPYKSGMLVIFKQEGEKLITSRFEALKLTKTQLTDEEFKLLSISTDILHEEILVRMNLFNIDMLSSMISNVKKYCKLNEIDISIIEKDIAQFEAMVKKSKTLFRGE